MDHMDDVAYQRLRRREELRKAETAMGGRTKYVSPLELFRMNLDAEASGGDLGDETDGDSNRDPSEVGTTARPLSPDDCKAEAHQDDKETWESTEECPPLSGTKSDDQNVVFTRESWLKSMFPFKQCRKAIKSAKNRGVVDMSTTSKESFFRHPLYLSRLKSLKNNQVEESSVSTSQLSRISPKPKIVEESDKSMTKRIITTIRSDKRRGCFSERGGKEYQDDDLGAFDLAGPPDYSVRIDFYRRKAKIPLGREDSCSLSPAAQKTPSRKIGGLTKVLFKTRNPNVDLSLISAAPDQYRTNQRRLSEASTMSRPGSEEPVELIEILGFNLKRRQKRRGIPPCHSGNHEVGRPVAMDLQKRRPNGGPRPGRCTDEAMPGKVFTAFVPFKGFAGFERNEGSLKSERLQIERSLASQCSSVD